MKRRDFIAAGSLLSLFGSAWAAPTRKPAASAKKQPVRRKPVKKPIARAKKPAGPTARTAETPMIDRPPDGTSASRLPPVRAPEPPTDWRSYEIVTTISAARSDLPGKLWLPLPSSQDSLYQRSISHRWNDNADEASLRRLPDGDLEVYCCEWKAGAEPRLQITTTVATADRLFDVTRRTVAPEREDILRRNLQASSLIPNDEAAHKLGERIVGRIKDPVAQAKAIYDWVVDNTVYLPEMPPVGQGDIRKLLDSGQYGGRSAEINGLFVALCRAIGIPARCVYGLRVGHSRLSRTLGVSDENATQAQHCRAEFYIPGYGWIPVDPSDVRRVMALEGLRDGDQKLASLRKILFGVWEMNWVAFNVGSDLTLPGSEQKLPFFVLPRFERGGNDQASFHCEIRARRSEA